MCTWKEAHWNVTDVGGEVRFVRFESANTVAKFLGDGENEGLFLDLEFVCGVETKLLPVMHQWGTRVWTLQTPAVCGEADFVELKKKITYLESG